MMNQNGANDQNKTAEYQPPKKKIDRFALPLMFKRNAVDNLRSKLIIRLPQNSSVYDKPRIKGQKGISNLQNITKPTNPQPSPTDTLPPTACSKAERRTA